MKSREIIHEFVNMARHPEAKDLAEALNEEKSHKDCLIQLDCYKNIMTMEIFLLKWQDHQSKWGACELLPHKILGRPITAFDVCCALNKKQSEYYYFATDNGIWAGYGLKDKCEGIIALMVEFKTKESDGTDIFSTEWSDDTSDTIVKFINL